MTDYKLWMGCFFNAIEENLRNWINGRMTDKKYTEQMLQYLNLQRDELEKAGAMESLRKHNEEMRENLLREKP